MAPSTLNYADIFTIATTLPHHTYITMESTEFNGSTWWRVAPLREVIKLRCGPVAFNPIIWGTSIALWSVAIWLAIDLVFQLHITFRRRSGFYYWAVLCTSVGVGLHASMLLLKRFTNFSMAGEMAVTAVLKTGDIMNQTGFSLVLYSRLGLVMRSADPRYLRLLLFAICAGSFFVNTPQLVFNFGTKIPAPQNEVWIARKMIAERIVGVYFTIQEFVLSTMFTCATADFIKTDGCLMHQSSKTCRNLLLFMIAAQATTFLADAALVALLFANLYFKIILHPFLFGVKLKFELAALNQLQNFVQPEVRLVTLTNASHDDSSPHPFGPRGLNGASGSDHDVEKALSDVESALTETSSNWPQVCVPSRTHAVQVNCIEDADDISFSHLERQYLGRSGG